MHTYILLAPKHLLWLSYTHCGTDFPIAVESPMAHLKFSDTTDGAQLPLTGSPAQQTAAIPVPLAAALPTTSTQKHGDKILGE